MNYNARESPGFGRRKGAVLRRNKHSLQVLHIDRKTPRTHHSILDLYVFVLFKALLDPRKNNVNTNGYGISVAVFA